MAIPIVPGKKGLTNGSNDTAVHLCTPLPIFRREKVCLARLDMSSTKSCILGQTDSDYGNHMRLLGIDEGEPFGFDVPNDPQSLIIGRYARLKAEWKRVLKGVQ